MPIEPKIDQATRQAGQKPMQLGPLGLELIKGYEGLRLYPYLCPAGVPTIGYGTTMYPNGRRVTLQDKPLKEHEADVILNATLEPYCRGVLALLKITPTQFQFDALVCFAYNVGLGSKTHPGGLMHSTLLKFVNAKKPLLTIEAEFMKWVKAGGKVLPGLVARRQAEFQLYSKTI